MESLLGFKISMCWGVRRTCLLEVGLCRLDGEEEGETDCRAAIINKQRLGSWNHLFPHNSEG